MELEKSTGIVPKEIIVNVPKHFSEKSIEEKSRLTSNVNKVSGDMDFEIYRRENDISHIIIDTYSFARGCNEYLRKKDLKELSEISSNNRITNDIDYDENDDNIVDELFPDAGRFVIKRNKLTIGMLQREFKINYKQEAIIIDRLLSSKVIGNMEENQTKEILMSLDQFEEYLESL